MSQVDFQIAKQKPVLLTVEQIAQTIQVSLEVCQFQIRDTKAGSENPLQVPEMNADAFEGVGLK